MDRALATRYPVVVVFEDPECDPCRRLEPVLERLARDFVDRVRVVRVEDACEPAVAARFGVTRVPTLLFRRHGIEVARIEGAPSLSTLRAYLAYLAGQGPRPPQAHGNAVPLPTAGAGATGRPLPADDESFAAAVLASPLPVLVDFQAAWCQPCHSMAPVVENLAARYSGRLSVVELDTDASPVQAARYGVVSVPTFILFRGGRPVYRVNGAVPPETLERAVQVALSAP